MSKSIHFATFLIMTGILVFAIRACKGDDENSKSNSKGHTLKNSQPKKIEESKKANPSDPRVDSTVRSEEERQLTFSSENDEDPSVILARDGKYYAAFISARHGVVGIFMKTSDDAVSWSEAYPILDGPHKDMGPNLFQTADGTFHMFFWRSKEIDWIRNIYYIHSKDAKMWSDSTNLTDHNSTNWAGNTFVDDQGRFTMVFSSNRTGNQELYQMYSKDEGQNWSEPAKITDHPLNDDFPFLYQMDDGRYLLAWTRFDKKGGIFYANKTTDIYYMYSDDGFTWNAQQHLLTDDRQRQFLDMIPFIFEFGEEAYLMWMTWGRGEGRDGAVAVPLSDLDHRQAKFYAMGFSYKFVRTENEGEYIMFYVHDAIDRERKERRVLSVHSK
ncbi:MAG: glycoside hydrolase family protein [Planctomycetota bacterium]